MLSLRKPSRHARTQLFPGDPRFGVVIKPPASDVECLKKRAFLSTALLDYIINLTTLLPDSTLSHTVQAVEPLLGSLGAEAFISSMNLTASIKREQARTKNDWKAYQNHIRKIRTKFKNVLKYHVKDGDFKNILDENIEDVPQRLIIPIVRGPPDSPGHFFVACFDFSVNDPKFFVNVCFYDSMERARTRIHRSSTAAEIVEKVNFFFKFYILHEAKYQSLHQSDVDVLQRAQYKECPRQNNGYDCGIFTVAVVLHLLERKEVDEMSFTQSNVTEGRKHLATALINAKSPSREQIRGVFRKCFPLLFATEEGNSSVPTIDCTEDQDTLLSVPLQVCGAAYDKETTSVDEDEDNIALRVRDTKDLATLTASVDDEDENNIALRLRDTKDLATLTADVFPLSNRNISNEAKVKDDDEEFFDTIDTDTESQMEDAAASKTENEDSVSALSGDTTFYDLMKEAKLQCFPTLEAVNPIVEAYEVRTGNYLRIKRSINDKFRVYECREHLGCPFQIRISRRRADGSFVVSKMKTKHSDVRRPAKAKDGRKWKKRRHAKLNDIVVKVLKTKDGDPTPNDVIKTAANECGIIVPYMTAYRVITTDAGVGRRLIAKSFEQIIPYVEAMKKCNPKSVIGCTKNETNELVDVYFFPGFMNEALKFVRPVVSLDATHLRSEYKGTLYVASVLSGNNDVFPIGLMISSGNEDGATWTKMLRLLKQASPILSGRSFVFISDRDKGLKAALDDVFPRNLEFSCAKHIESNVTQRFGKQCGRYVMAMAKTYSARNAANMLDLVRQIKPSAAAYIESIESGGVLWKCSQWIAWQHSNLPPRYGIVTSNTSESVNNMFSEARDLAWMEALEKIVDIMSTRIGDCRTKYLKREDSEVVPRVAQILKARWDAAASMAVMEIELGCGEFKVTSSEYGSTADEGEHDIVLSVAHGSPMHQRSIHIVRPGVQWCSCGAWQDCMFPCRHACAVYRKWKEVDFNYVLTNLVDKNYTFANVKSTFKRNVFPVTLDGIKYDGVTKPPLVVARPSGRPRTRRIRRRSEFLAAEDSPVVCSNCGIRGHNRRTCTNPARERTDLITNS